MAVADLLSSDFSRSFLRIFLICRSVEASLDLILVYAFFRFLIFCWIRAIRVSEFILLSVKAEKRKTIKSGAIFVWDLST